MMVDFSKIADRVKDVDKIKFEIRMINNTIKTYWEEYIWINNMNHYLHPGKSIISKSKIEL